MDKVFQRSPSNYANEIVPKSDIISPEVCDTRIWPDMFAELKLKPRNSRVELPGSMMTQLEREGRSLQSFSSS